LIKNGSSVARIGLDEDADRRLLLKMAQKHKVLLQAQEEMQSEKQNRETSAISAIASSVADSRRTFAPALDDDERQDAVSKFYEHEAEHEMNQ
jgi:hypothetical protein